jgi:hypothetical protein
VIIFIAAPDIIRWLYRIRAAKKEDVALNRGLGS